MFPTRCLSLMLLLVLLSRLPWLATAVVVREVNAATQQILGQAYAFTLARIAQALLEAHKRGVTILVVLDKSNETAQYSAATFLVNMGIQTRIDDQHAIAHNKVMVI